jgi:hypothetical protein
MAGHRQLRTQRQTHQLTVEDLLSGEHAGTDTLDGVQAAVGPDLNLEAVAHMVVLNCIGKRGT